MKFNYVCTECNEKYEIKPTLMLCTKCQEIQQAQEPLRGILEVELTGTYEKPISELDPLDFLPVEKFYFPKIPVGNTPLWEPRRLRQKLSYPNLFIKDDTTNPTSSYKDRASFLVAAFAIKHKITEIVVASTGNAASSMAGIGASANLDVTIFIPKSAPKAKMVQSLQYGARVILVDGNYDKAYELSLEYIKTNGGLSRNTAYNPLTIEGKKTAAFEIFKDLGFKVPDYVFVPTGDGVILSGIYKGFCDLKKFGFSKRVPTIFAVQAASSNAISRAMKNKGKFDYQKSNTIADSISVDVPKDGYHSIKNLLMHKGWCVEVNDQDILSAQKELSESTGLFVEPAAASSYAGFLSAKSKIDKNATVVLLATGHGLKDVDSAMSAIEVPTRAINSISEIK